MERQDANAKYYTVDLLHIIKSIWQRIWMVIIAAFLAALIGFGFSTLIIKPSYSSTVKLYVNNSSISIGNASFSISSSEITAAQSLVKTYGEILNNRSTLERVIDHAGVDYEWDVLSTKIKSGTSNGTEIMFVTVTTNDPEEAALIANSIAEVLPEVIAGIIDGASMEVVDTAAPNYKKVGPSITKYTAVGFILGAILSMVVIAINAMMDDRIHDEDYIIETYDYPILAKIPNLVNPDGKGRYGRYSKYYYYSRAYKSSDYASANAESNDESTVSADDSNN